MKRAQKQDFSDLVENIVDEFVEVVENDPYVKNKIVKIVMKKAGFDEESVENILKQKQK